MSMTDLNVHDYSDQLQDQVCNLDTHSPSSVDKMNSVTLKCLHEVDKTIIETDQLKERTEANLFSVCNNNDVDPENTFHLAKQESEQSLPSCLDTDSEIIKPSLIQESIGGSARPSR